MYGREGSGAAVLRSVGTENYAGGDLLAGPDQTLCFFSLRLGASLVPELDIGVCEKKVGFPGGWLRLHRLFQIWKSLFGIALKRQDTAHQQVRSIVRGSNI